MGAIPVTKRRLAGATKFFIIPGKGKKAVSITAMVSFGESNPRVTTEHYELDADVYGEIVEQTPKYAGRSFKIKRAVLYTSDMLEFFGVEGDDLVNQTEPFTLQKVEYLPGGSVSKTTNYVECWFQDNPKDYEIAGDLVIIQEVDVKYSRKEVVK